MEAKPKAIRQRQRLTSATVINVDRPNVDLSAIRTGRSRSQRTAEQSRFANELRNKRPEHFVDSRWQTFTPRLSTLPMSSDRKADGRDLVSDH